MKWAHNKDTLWGVLVLLPSVILLGIFVYGFIAQTLYTSLTDWGQNPAQALATNPQLKFIGLQNYIDLFTSPINSRFRQDLVSTLFFTLFFIAGCLGLGLGLAMALDRGPRGEGFFRTVFLFPMSLSFVVTGTIWRWMLQPSGGINQLPTIFGLEAGQFGWLTTRQQVWSFSWNDLPVLTGGLVSLVLLVLLIGALRSGQSRRSLWAGISLLVLLGWTVGVAPRLEPLPYDEPHGFNLAFIGILLAAVWQMAGYTMALYLAGLRGIPEELREAARVDGASEWELYRRIIFPMLSPITLSAMIILGHISLKIFDLIFAMAGKDYQPTSVPALTMFNTAFFGNNFAQGAAIGAILLLLVAAVIVPYLYSQLRGEVRR
jgi:glucose/mannose transport system permease protein